jgi:hypothetical protein
MFDSKQQQDYSTARNALQLAKANFMTWKAFTSKTIATYRLTELCDCCTHDMENNNAAR